jgi:hypothetical protein
MVVAWQGGGISAESPPREEQPCREDAMSPVAVVCADVETARAALAGGDHVVLIGDDAARLGRDAARLRGEGGAGSRVSVFVGDPSQGPVWSAASVMAAEQFRSDVRVVMLGARVAPGI